MIQLADPIASQLSTPKRWLVTGAAGFIGSSLVEVLLLHNQTVIGLDNLSTGKEKNLTQVRNSVGENFSKFRFTLGDIRDAQCCAEVCSRVDFVLHQAAVASVPLSIEQPLMVHDVNVMGTLNLFEAARRSGISKVIYASSSAVYGDSLNYPQIEDRIGRPVSPYAASKYINEVDAALYSKAYGLNTVGLRYFNVFGPRQDAQGSYAAVIPHWIEQILAGEDVVIFGSGEITRDFCYIADVVEANIRAALHDEMSGHVFNIGSGCPVTLLELFNAIRQSAASLGIDYPREAIIGPPREGDIPNSGASTQEADSKLGFKAKTRLEDGLRETIAYYLGDNRA